MKKKPHYFCDNCGVEVSATADSCPKCGRFFSSIRCPKCGFTGDQGKFTKGCPVCGYSNPEGKKPRSQIGNKSGLNDSGHSGTTPAWFLGLAVALLVLAFAILFNYISS